MEDDQDPFDDQELFPMDYEDLLDAEDASHSLNPTGKSVESGGLRLVSSTTSTIRNQ
jgi:hypothetical protein